MSFWLRRLVVQVGADVGRQGYPRQGLARQTHPRAGMRLYVITSSRDDVNLVSPPDCHVDSLLHSWTFTARSECESRLMGMRNRENGIPSCRRPVSPPPGPGAPRRPLASAPASCLCSCLLPNNDVGAAALCGCTIMARFPDPGRAFLPQPISSFPTNPRRTGAPPPLRVNPRRPSTPHLHVILGPCTRHPPEHSLRCLTALVETSSRHVLHHVSASSSWRQEALFCCRRCLLQTSLPPGPRRCCCCCCCLNQSAPVDKTNQSRARSKDGS